MDPCETRRIFAGIRSWAQLTPVVAQTSKGGEWLEILLELLRELVPGATRFSVLVNPSNAANAESIMRDVETAGRADIPPLNLGASLFKPKSRLVI
jgi:hypothetical protein